MCIFGRSDYLRRRLSHIDNSVQATCWPASVGSFSIVETACRNVKRWRGGDHIERWVGSGLLVAERQFHKVQGYREIPSLLTALANGVSKKAVAEEVKVA
jgi:hypothetical protein